MRVVVDAVRAEGERREPYLRDAVSTTLRRCRADGVVLYLADIRGRGAFDVQVFFVDELLGTSFQGTLHTGAPEAFADATEAAWTALAARELELGRVWMDRYLETDDPADLEAATTEPDLTSLEDAVVERAAEVLSRVWQALAPRQRGLLEVGPGPSHRFDLGMGERLL
ncbi:MAG: hypothetical protein KC656_07645 [Myxococcales bacterium]|nr:hypothetical protein [Myxococcales bacterium]